MQLPEALAQLDRHPRSIDVAPARPHAGDQPGSLARLLEVMGDPERAAPVIAVAGTSGTDTVVRMLSALIAETGLVVGASGGRHLEVVAERLMRNGESIGGDELAQVLGDAFDIEQLAGVHPSWLDVVTAAALSWFAQVAADVVVLDLGSAGIAHPASVIGADLLVVTDATADTVEGLAALVRPGQVVVLGSADDEVRAVIDAREPGEVIQRDLDYHVDDNLPAVGGRVIDLRTPAGAHGQVFVPLHGAQQGERAATAVAAAEAFFGRGVDESVVSDGLAGVVVPGRFEVVGHGPLLVVDAAADPDEAEWVGATLAGDFDVSGRRLLVVGLTADVDPLAMVDALGGTDFDEIIATTSPASEGHDGLDAQLVAAAVAEVGAEADVVADLGDALDGARSRATPDDAVVVVGSAALAGRARAHLRRSSPDDR